ncbi:hypothetical protein [Streptomyces sp. NBC_00154]|nr:hypothetical protein [Streptomyces sp. NBC_00154]MCX5317873.1 hypothetical protein [Streptomyces sp. NBC_00154]
MRALFRGKVSLLRHPSHALALGDYAEDDDFRLGEIRGPVGGFR